MSTGAWGYFGKLASEGDFLRHALPRAFVTVWDAWLQAGILESRKRLGENWLACYLSAPIWRFATAPGVAGPSAMVGVLMPSVDRVGRHFPLTVAAEAGHAQPFMLLASGPRAFAEIEEAALATLEDDARRDALDAMLARAATIECDTAVTRRRHHSAEMLRAGAGAAAAAIADRLCDDRHGAISLWTAERGEGDGSDAVTLIVPGLPSAQEFATLVAPPHDAVESSETIS